MRKLIAFKVTAILIAVLAVLFLTYFVITEVVRLRPTIEERVAIDSQQLEYSIRQVAELSTLVYNYTDIGFFDEQAAIAVFGREFNLPGTRRQLIARFEGAIRFGVDVSRVSVSVGEYVVTVHLPRVEMQVHTIDMDSIQLLDERTGIFVSFDLDDYAEIIAGWQQEIESRAIIGELLEQARQNTEEVLGVLLLSALPEEYAVNFVWR